MKQRKSKTKIILVANTTWYLYNFRFPLIKELVNQNYQVIVLSPSDRYVKHFQKYRIEHIHIKIIRSGLNPFADIILLLRFINIYIKIKPDLVQHFTIKPVIYGTIAARVSGIKYIYNMIPGLGYVFTDNSLKKSIVRKFVEFLYRRSLVYSKHVFFQNREDQNYFIKHKIVNGIRTSVISGTGVDIHSFFPVKKEQKNGITFILMARMLWDKGIKEYVEAAQKLKKKYQNVKFWLLGPIDRQNPRSITSQQLVNWNKDGFVKYLGMTDNVKSYLTKADVVVLPSYYREGLPLSLLEAAAMGMPIITADSVGCREVVKDRKNGYLVPIKDAAAISSAMEKFILEPGLVSRMGKESRKIAVSKFNSKKVVQKILNYYP